MLLLSIAVSILHAFSCYHVSSVFLDKPYVTDNIVKACYLLELHFEPSLTLKE